MRTVVPAILVIAALGGATHAQTSDPGEMAETLFDRIDRDGNGQVRLDELAAFDEEALASMTGDGDDAASRDEFVGWGFGFDALGRSGDPGPSYETVARVVFDLIDYDNDGAVTQGEMSRFRTAVAEYADHDGDDVLNLQEFSDHHVYSMVARAVLSQD